MPIPHLLEVSHVAHRLSVSQRFVRQLIRDGKLRAIWLETRWRVELSELEAYLDRCRQAAKEVTRQAVKPFPRANA